MEYTIMRLADGFARVLSDFAADIADALRALGRDVNAALAAARGETSGAAQYARNVKCGRRSEAISLETADGGNLNVPIGTDL